MFQWLAPSTVEEEREQLQLRLYHSTIGNQDSDMLSQKPPETDQPKETGTTNAVQGLLSLSPKNLLTVYLIKVENRFVLQTFVVKSGA